MSTSSLAELKTQRREIETMSDTRVDMFSLQGFALAQRIAQAFASSDAVPVAFRSHVLKKVGRDEVWVENPNAMGNCLVAIEVAQAVGMSVTAVMQNADVIEGKLRWSGKFVIAAINASRRFTPLEFHIKNLGMIKAKYKEKMGWNDSKKGFDFVEREVEVENLECIAYAYVIENGRRTDKRVDGAPVSMQMAVEEGWYAKSGSKWQTSMRMLMLQYRAGTFFGNIHAPDVVMGMGRTAEEERDVVELFEQPDGGYGVTVDELKSKAARGSVVIGKPVDEPLNEPVDKPTAAPTPAPTDSPTPAPTPAPTAQPKQSRLSPEEIAAIEAQEKAELGQQQPEQRPTRTRSPRSDMSVE